MSDSPDFRFYYLSNFEQALDWLRRRYADLLSDEERLFLDQFALLERDTRALLVRLVMRRGPVFRESKIQYEEIGSLERAVQTLADVEWIDCDPMLNADAVGALLPKATLASHLGLNHSLPKSELCERLIANYPQPRSASSWQMFGGERVIHVTVAELCLHLRLLFFGNFHQDWKEFVLTDLGIFKYEPVSTHDGRAFQSREHIEAFYALFRARRALEEDQPLQHALELLPTGPLDEPWLCELRAKLQFSIAREFERAGQFAQAYDLYAQCDHPGALARSVRVLERQGRVAEALTLAQSDVCAELIEPERQLIDRAIRRIAGRSADTAVKKHSIQTINLELEDWERVEQGAAISLHAPDEPVFYVENLLINALFGLWCWDVIFAPVVGAFFHPFQRGPADLWSPQFASRRASDFERAFERLEADAHVLPILETYRAKQGISNPFVFWNGLTEELIQLALICIPAAHLKLIFKRMLVDLERNSSGFPDLIQFYVTEKRYRFVEVKGPGDRLQDHQRRWMEFFADHGIPALVCRVARTRAVA
ncbi:MAG: VRR-NUC domain-containing protein [Povalibacter sp.]